MTRTQHKHPRTSKRKKVRQKAGAIFSRFMHSILPPSPQMMAALNSAYKKVLFVSQEVLVHILTTQLSCPPPYTLCPATEPPIPTEFIHNRISIITTTLICQNLAIADILDCMRKLRHCVQDVYKYIACYSEEETSLVLRAMELWDDVLEAIEVVRKGQGVLEREKKILIRFLGEEREGMWS